MFKQSYSARQLWVALPSLRGTILVPAMVFSLICLGRSLQV
jgi:hypothetical protein